MPVCNCRPFLLRWLESPVTWSYAQAGEQIATIDILRNAFTAWTAVCGIEFIELVGQVGQIHYRWDSIDGPGSTLGQALQPSTGDNMNVATWSGDITIDSSETSWTPQSLYDVSVHEIGHAIGIGHSPQPGDVMYAFYDGTSNPIGPWSTSQAFRRYPTSTMRNAHLAAERTCERYCNWSTEELQGLVATLSESIDTALETGDVIEALKVSRQAMENELNIRGAL